MTPRSRMRADDVLYRQRETHRADGRMFHEFGPVVIIRRRLRDRVLGFVALELVTLDVTITTFAVAVIVAVLTGVLQ